MLAHSSLLHLASVPLVVTVLGFSVGLVLGFLTWYYGWGTQLVKRWVPKRVKNQQSNRGFRR